MAWWCHLALLCQQGCDPALPGISAPADEILGCAGMAAAAARCQPVADGTASITPVSCDGDGHTELLELPSRQFREGMKVVSGVIQDPKAGIKEARDVYRPPCSP